MLAIACDLSSTSSRRPSSGALPCERRDEDVEGVEDTCIGSVVRGLMTVEPARARSENFCTNPVSASMQSAEGARTRPAPPIPCDVCDMSSVHAPLASLVVLASPTSHSALPVVSSQIVQPLRAPSYATPLRSTAGGGDGGDGGGEGGSNLIIAGALGGGGGEGGGGEGYGGGEGGGGGDGGTGGGSGGNDGGGREGGGGGFTLQKTPPPGRKLESRSKGASKSSTRPIMTVDPSPSILLNTQLLGSRLLTS